MGLYKNKLCSQWWRHFRIPHVVLLCQCHCTYRTISFSHKAEVLPSVSSDFMTWLWQQSDLTLAPTSKPLSGDKSVLPLSTTTMKYRCGRWSRSKHPQTCVAWKISAVLHISFWKGRKARASVAGGRTVHSHDFGNFHNTFNPVSVPKRFSTLYSRPRASNSFSQRTTSTSWLHSKGQM